MKQQLIKDGVVVNTIVAENSAASAITGYDFIIQNNLASPGWTYKNGVFSPPEMVTEKILILTQLEFLRRFTLNERIKIRASQDLMVIDFLYLLSQAQEICLDDPDTVAGVNYLEQIGLIDENRATEILN